MAKIRQATLPVEFSKYARTKVTTMGNITEVTTLAKNCNCGCPCKKLDKDHYFDTRTGEVLEYEHIENRSEETRSIRNTLARIRALINTNVVEPDNCRWLTLTYAENMTDTKQLYEDFRRFWMRFCYWCKANGHEKPEYITVQEPQGRGAWHVHAFFIWQSKAPFLPNEEIAKLWGNGYTKTTAMQDCDNVGAYFSAYLGDMPVDEIQKLTAEEQQKATSGSLVEEKSFTDEQGNAKKKKFVKGGRLYLYPPGMNIVRTTKGVKQPEVEYMSRESAEKKVCSAKQTFSRDYEIVNDDGQVVNVISKAYYNSKRK
jgi:hypothetical protein